MENGRSRLAEKCLSRYRTIADKSMRAERIGTEVVACDLCYFYRREIFSRLYSREKSLFLLAGDTSRACSAEANKSWTRPGRALHVLIAT